MLPDLRTPSERLSSLAAILLPLVLGFVFLWSSLPKIQHPYLFLGNVYGYELAGPKLGLYVAMIIPWLECSLGIFLLGRVLLRGALLCGVLLMGLFTLGQAYALYHGLHVACGCFSLTGSTHVSYSTLISTSLILLFSGIAYCCVLVQLNADPST